MNAQVDGAADGREPAQAREPEVIDVENDRMLSGHGRLHSTPPISPSGLSKALFNMLRGSWADLLPWNNLLFTVTYLMLSITRNKNSALQLCFDKTVGPFFGLRMESNFDLTTFRLLMKQHRQGNVRQDLLKLLAYDGKPFIENSHVKCVNAEPTIVNDTLLMHTQTIYTVPPKQNPNASQVFLLDLLDRNLLKCPHSNRWTADNINFTNRLILRFAKQGTVPTGRREKVGSFRCPSCPTEYDVSMARFEGEGVLLFIDKWQDLGGGLSPLEHDYPTVVGFRRGLTVRSPKGFKKMKYESPKARFGGNSLAEPESIPLSHRDRF